MQRTLYPPPWTTWLVLPHIAVWYHSDIQHLKSSGCHSRSSSCRQPTDASSICGLWAGNVRWARRIRSGREQLMRRDSSRGKHECICQRTTASVLSHLVWYRSFWSLGLWVSFVLSRKHNKSPRRDQENVRNRKPWKTRWLHEEKVKWFYVELREMGPISSPVGGSSSIIAISGLLAG